MASDATMVSFCGYVLFSTVAHLGYQPYFFIVAGIGLSLINLVSRIDVRAPARDALAPAAAA
jgi:hypothetical protein